MKILKYLLIFYLVFPFSVFAEEYKVERVISVYDGDTFRADINCSEPILCKNLGIRLRGIDTPEKRGKCPSEKKLALQARDSLRGWLASAREIKLTNIDRGKYFRMIATVLVDGKDVSQRLINLKLARLYQGGKKSSWCK